MMSESRCLSLLTINGMDDTTGAYPRRRRNVCLCVFLVLRVTIITLVVLSLGAAAVKERVLWQQ